MKPLSTVAGMDNDRSFVIDPNSRAAKHRTGLAKAFAGVGLWSSLGRGLSDAVDYVIPSDEELLLVLENRLAHARTVERRSNWWGGKAVNKLVGETPGYVEMSGSHIKYVLKLVECDNQGPLDDLQLYGLKTGVAEEAVKLLTKPKPM
ncbi:MAG: hypothetical protein AAF557_27555 [Pseudomonadota bacterium]